MLSRVADSLYWMSRYIERAEHTARLIAVKLESMVEQTPEDAAASWTRVSRGADRRKNVDRRSWTLSSSPASWPSTATMTIR